MPRSPYCSSAMWAHCGAIPACNRATGGTRSSTFLIGPPRGSHIGAPLSVAAIPAPASKALLWDAQNPDWVAIGSDAFTEREWIGRNVKERPDVMAFRHNERANVVYVDGHVKTLHKNQASSRWWDFKATLDLQ